MNKKIETKWYINSGSDMVWFRYYLDDDVIWYSFDDLYETLHLDGRKADGMYNDLKSENKRIYYVMKNEYSGLQERFINISGLQEIEQRNVERFKTVYENIDSLNRQLGIYKQMSEKEVLKEYISHAIDRNALEEFKVNESKLDFVLEEDEKQNTLKKKHNCPTEEERIALYKKNKGNSSCPNWIKDLVK